MMECNEFSTYAIYSILNTGVRYGERQVFSDWNATNIERKK